MKLNHCPPIPTLPPLKSLGGMPATPAQNEAEQWVWFSRNQRLPEDSWAADIRKQYSGNWKYRLLAFSHICTMCKYSPASSLRFLKRGSTASLFSPACSPLPASVVGYWTGGWSCSHQSSVSQQWHLHSAPASPVGKRQKCLNLLR